MDSFNITLNSPLTEDDWDLITDVDFDRTNEITFHTKHNKEVSFVKLKKGKWLAIGNTSLAACSCGYITDRYSIYNYCPNCGAKMEGEEE